MALSSQQLLDLQSFVNVGDRIGYYRLLSDCGIPYGLLAEGVVSADTATGKAANIFFSSWCDRENVSIDVNELASLSNDLMVADFSLRAQGVDLGWEEIQRYHNDVFADHSVPADAWTANVALNSLSTDAERDSLWFTMTNSSSATAYVSIVVGMLNSQTAGNQLISDYLAILTGSGLATSGFDSNQNGLYEIVLANGVHVIADNHYDGPTSGTSGIDVIMGFGGEDILRGFDGDDHIYGGLGDDKLFGEDGNDLLSGDLGADVLDGGLGDDIYIVGQDGDADIVILSGGNDIIRGGDADDRIVLRGNALVSGVGEETEGLAALGGFGKNGSYTSSFTLGERGIMTWEDWKVIIGEPDMYQGDIQDEWDVVNVVQDWPFFNVYQQYSGFDYYLFDAGNGTENLMIFYSILDPSQQYTNPGMVTIEDFEEGDFGIKFYDMETFEDMRQMFGGEGDIDVATNETGFGYIWNDGQMIGIPAVPTI